MKVFVIHNSATLAALSGVAQPPCDAVILRHGAPAEILASHTTANPLGSDWLLDVESPGRTVLSWTGTLAAGLFESDPRTWSRPGREALARFCDEIAPQLAAHDRTLCFQPHARHVLNDAPSCLTFLRDRASQPFSIALAPASLLEPSMLDRVEEHLERQFESLGRHCEMVLLGDVQVARNGDDDAHCQAVPLGDGLLPREHVIALLRDSVPESTPIVIDGRSGGAAIQQQLAWLLT